MEDGESGPLGTRSFADKNDVYSRQIFKVFDTSSLLSLARLGVLPGRIVMP